jgi:hypothetical protein
LVVVAGVPRDQDTAGKNPQEHAEKWKRSNRWLPASIVGENVGNCVEGEIHDTVDDRDVQGDDVQLGELGFADCEGEALVERENDAP